MNLSETALSYKYLFCVNCGEELKDHVKFCGKCGSPVGSDKSQISPKVLDNDPYLKKPSSDPRPKKKTSSKKKIFILFAVVIIGSLIYVYLASGAISVGYNFNAQYGSLSQEELSTMAIPWTYEDVVRNPGEYSGKIMYVEGPVEFTINDRLAIPITCGSHPYNLICKYAIVDNYSEIRVLTGDWVSVYGYFGGTEQRWPQGDPSPIIKSVYVECTSC